MNFVRGIIMTYKDKYLQWLSFADEDTNPSLKVLQTIRKLRIDFIKTLLLVQAV